MTQVLSGLTGGDYIAINPVNGDMWITGTTNVYVVSAAGTLLSTLTPGGKPSQVTYYMNGATPTMAVICYVVGATFIATYNATTRVVIDASLTVLVTQANRTVLFYSNIFNLLFTLRAASTEEVVVLNLDGTENDSLDLADLGFTVTDAPFSLYNFIDDYKNLRVYKNFFSNAVVYSDTLSVPVGIYYGSDGEETITATLENEVPPVLQTEADQCIPEAAMNSLAQYFKRECGCNPTVSTGTSGGSSAGTYTIYYGNSTDDALDNTGIEALTSVSQSGYAGSYGFIATSPSEFKYISAPTILGSPSRFYDLSTGFDVAMDTVYQVVINAVTYNVWRTYYELGGAIVITLQS